MSDPVTMSHWACHRWTNAKAQLNHKFCRAPHQYGQISQHTSAVHRHQGYQRISSLQNPLFHHQSDCQCLHLQSQASQERRASQQSSASRSRPQSSHPPKWKQWLHCHCSQHLPYQIITSIMASSASTSTDTGATYIRNLPYISKPCSDINSYAASDLKIINRTFSCPATCCNNNSAPTTSSTVTSRSW